MERLKFCTVSDFASCKQVCKLLTICIAGFNLSAS